VSQITTQTLIDELESLRGRVVGMSESVISATDGLLVASDTSTSHPESMAALASATLGLGKRTATQSALGQLVEVVNRCNGGYVVVLPIRERALLVVIGDEGLDLAGLRRESSRSIETLATLLDAGSGR
jgi:predicted regulator of Ras-like GTPase activity (Roadblock/LC7/MglB family)